MKKILHLLFISFFLGLCYTTYAQNPSQNILSDNDEGIFLFDVDIQVQSNGTIQVKEYIALNAQWQKIRRGIYRDIPVSLTERVTPVSLNMDGNSHPFFTERQIRSLRVNFGNDNYITKGIHAYSFVYTYTGAINFLKNYDELYWNVTGNDWAFPIEKARVRVSFPSNVNIQKDGISVYTGRVGQKNHDAKQIGPLAFETTKPLWPQEGLTIAIPFDKGAIQKPAVSSNLDILFSFPFVIFLALFIFLIGYFVFTWFTVGKDPSYLAIAQYDPPQDISPAFMYYLQNQFVDSKLLACAILNLAMKGYIEIKTTSDLFPQDQKANPAQNLVLGALALFASSHWLIRTEKQPNNLSYEEQQILNILFAVSDKLPLNASAASQFEALKKAITTQFKTDAKQYIISNASYLTIAIIITLILGTVYIVNDKLFQVEVTSCGERLLYDTQGRYVGKSGI